MGSHHNTATIKERGVEMILGASLTPSPLSQKLDSAYLHNNTNLEKAMRTVGRFYRETTDFICGFVYGKIVVTKKKN